MVHWRSGHGVGLAGMFGALLFIVGLLVGIVVARAKIWLGWIRFMPSLQRVYYLLAMMMHPLIPTASNEPTLLTESLSIAT